MRGLPLLLLAACASEPSPPKHTLEDAGREVAESLCAKWIECQVAGGPPIVSYQACVEELVWDFCNQVLDMHKPGVSCVMTEYPEESWQELLACTQFYQDLSCSIYVEACHVKEVW